MSRGNPRIIFRLEPIFYQQLKNAAIAQGLTVSDILRNLVFDYLLHLPRQPEDA